MSGLRSAVVVLVAAGAVVAPGGGHAVASDSGPPERRLSVDTGDGQVLPATLRLPARPLPGRPAMVLVDGAGPGHRDDLRDEAEAFTEAGVATLVYDKRTVGYSFTRRSYSLLADDAVAAAAVMRRQPGVDAGNVGLWGLSEGGWVAPLAAARDPRTAFLVVVGANGGAPLPQQSWAERIKIEHAGVRGSLVDAYAYTAYRLINGLGLFPEAYHDAGAAPRVLTLPVLGVWGDRDVQTPPVESVAAYRTALDAAGNRRYTLRTVAGAEHTVRVSTDGWDRGAEFAPGYVDLVTAWASQAVTGRAPAPSVAGTGMQSRTTVPVPALRWYESAPVQVGAFVTLILAFAGFGLAAPLRRIRGRRGPRAPWSARLLAGTGLAAVIGWPLYLGSLLFTSGGTLTTNGAIHAGPLLGGRPLLWLALQALAVVTVAAGIVTAVRHRPAPGDRLRTAVVLGATTVFAAWALYWGLLLP
ncbi:MAG: prolyl oligopeptidase family serine peptidase [Streptosporangiales bacterium]|nr:prolyl oligopeptidase family serine peptidase [Streptosporangiales bacterium]